MAAQWPLVKAHMLTLLPTLTHWTQFTVYNGQLVIPNPPPRYATVGWLRTGETGGYGPVQQADESRWEERGTLFTEVVRSLDNTDQATAESDLFAALNDVEAAIRADRRFGVLSPEGSASFQVVLAPSVNAEGRVVLAHFALHYYTVT